MSDITHENEMIEPGLEAMFEFHNVENRETLETVLDAVWCDYYEVNRVEKDNDEWLIVTLCQTG